MSTARRVASSTAPTGRQGVGAAIPPVESILSTAVARGAVRLARSGNQVVDPVLLSGLWQWSGLDDLASPPPAPGQRPTRPSKETLLAARRAAAASLRVEERDAIGVALDAVAGSGVRTVAEASLDLWSRGITAVPVHPAVIASAAGALGIEAPFLVVDAGHRSWLDTAPADGQSYDRQPGSHLVVPVASTGRWTSTPAAWVSAARARLPKIIEHDGPLTLAALAAREGMTPDAAVTLLDLGPSRDDLGGPPGRHHEVPGPLHVEDRAGETWLWTGQSRPRSPLAIAAVRTLLSGPMTLDLLHDGISLVARYRAWQPPRPDLLARWGHAQWWLCQDQAGRWALHPETDISCVGQADLVLADLTAGGEVFSLHELTAALLAAGLAPASVQVLALRAPCLRRVARNRYSARGERSLRTCP